MSSDKIKQCDPRLLLHVCCAPCSCVIIERLLEEGFQPTILFYNPNISPRDEYERRKASVIAFAQKKKILFIDGDHTHENWLMRVKGLEHEPERGTRCSVCFDVRLEYTALYAHEHKYSLFATTNGIGRLKDRHQVDQSGIKAALPYPELEYLARNWRENDALTRGAKITREEGFYRQNYCGCEFSQNVMKQIHL